MCARIRACMWKMFHIKNRAKKRTLNSDIKKISFIYSFDMSKEISHFKLMPKETQSSAEANAVSVIYESFVVSGDEDYLMSRLLAQKGLQRGFYWAAAQAVEKYLKAFLIMNGDSVKEFKKHPIKQLFEAAGKIDISLLSLNISPHPSIQVEEDFSHRIKKFSIQQFIGELEKHGDAGNRYNAFGVEYNTGHLFAMDSLSFQLRGKIGVASIEETLKRTSPDLIETFEKNNPWFCTDENLSPITIPSKDCPLQSSNSVTHLEFLIKQKDKSPAYGLALRWLNAKMKLPKEISEQLANH